MDAPSNRSNERTFAETRMSTYSPSTGVVRNQFIVLTPSVGAWVSTNRNPMPHVSTTAANSKRTFCKIGMLYVPSKLNLVRKCGPFLSLLPTCLTSSNSCRKLR